MTPNIDNDPLQGTRYRTLSFLGRGAMGVVVEAEHTALKKRCCVKVLHRALTSNEQLVDRFRLEAQGLAQLDHLNIVRVTDFGHTSSDQPFLVMERLEGQNLEEELRDRGFLPVVEAIDFAAQILDGLTAAHHVGMVHRDLKPANIFVCRSGSEKAVIKILDFGVAKLLPSPKGGLEALSKPTQEGVAIGTPRYFSPEQAMGAAIDARTDLYAAGLVLFRMLAGRGCFDHHSDIVSLCRAHLTESPKPPSSYAQQPVAAAIDLVVLGALKKEPADRPSSAEEFKRRLLSARGAAEAASKGSQLARLYKTAEVEEEHVPTRRASNAELVAEASTRPANQLLGPRGTEQMSVDNSSPPSTDVMSDAPTHPRGNRSDARMLDRVPTVTMGGRAPQGVAPAHEPPQKQPKTMISAGTRPIAATADDVRVESTRQGSPRQSMVGFIVVVVVSALLFAVVGWTVIWL